MSKNIIPGCTTAQQVAQIKKHVPKYLKECKQWVMWRLLSRNGNNNNPTKVPYTPNGMKAKVNDPLTWSGFEVCLQALRDGSFNGIGFVFAKGDGLSGIDLDHCFDENGDIEPWAQEVVDRFSGTYIEKSPSADGLHIWCFGQPVKTGAKKWKRESDGVEQGVEVYNYRSPRYFTMTGFFIGNCLGHAIDGQDGIDWLYQKYFSKNVKENIQNLAYKGQVSLKLVGMALEYIPAENYHTWITVGMALKSAGLNVEIWDKWSQSSHKYEPGQCEKKWVTFDER